MNEQFYLEGVSVADAEPYHYDDCGLGGVYLLNGVEKEEYDGEEYVTIRNVEGLHVAIGKHLVFHNTKLNGREIRFLRQTLDLTQEELANIMGNDAQSIARWEKERSPIPGPADGLLRARFLAMVMSDEELDELRDFLLEDLSEINSAEDEAEFCEVVRFQHIPATSAWTEPGPQAACA